MPRFAGRTAIVTGASRGIGLAIAERLVADGAKVVVTARKQEALDEAVARLGGPEHAIGVAGQADDVDHQAEVVKRAIDVFGSVDLLVNNTGINPVYGPHGRAGPGRGPQDRRGQLHRRAVVGAAGAPGLDGRARRRRRQRLVGGRPAARAGHRLLRRQQGDAHPHHRRSWRSSSARTSG